MTVAGLDGAPQTCSAARPAALSTPAAAPAAATILAASALGGSSNGRTSGFGPENRGLRPWPPAASPRRPAARAPRLRAFSINLVSAPIALILAAGQGTRMRSRTPKVLHDVCGLPMVLWPVRAAAAAGAGRIVVVDSPARALREVLPDDVEVAVQERPDG